MRILIENNENCKDVSRHPEFPGCCPWLLFRADIYNFRPNSLPAKPSYSTREQTPLVTIQHLPEEAQRTHGYGERN